MKTVRDILKVKGTQIWTIPPDSTIFEALQLMAEKGIGALLVIEKDAPPVGIVSERDYARKVALEGKSSKTSKVKEIMSPDVLYVDIHTNIEKCMALMINKRIRHLPVYDEDKLTGIISIGDVVKAVIHEQEFLIKELENYITGRR
jgi:signal-transduction protein with cAMP-binding, CBS, and nucleotidyltransferase domain